MSTNKPYQKKRYNNNYQANNGFVDAFEAQKSRKDCKVVYGEFYFTRVGKPITQINTKAEGLIDVEPHFKANVVLSDASVKYFRDMNFNVRDAGAGIPRPHLTLKRNVKDRTTKIDIFDKDGNEMDPSILIGNGSKGQALMYVYELPDGTKNGALLGVQITDLVPYEAGVSTKEATPTKARPSTSSGYQKPATTARKKMSYQNKQENEESMQQELDDSIPF